ncbi:unnamed protein product [Moneuplotes crassus]|uniref:Uncharacterized protein n=1 Tax=Euplotes crassus TaxID=5936 RepID=A0AAD1XZD0_EUPCR|nr:unnamed protein product [Moneuplotes crassus]
MPKSHTMILRTSISSSQSYDVFLNQSTQQDTDIPSYLSQLCTIHDHYQSADSYPNLHKISSYTKNQ